MKKLKPDTKALVYWTPTTRDKYIGDKEVREVIRKHGAVIGDKRFDTKAECDAWIENERITEFVRSTEAMDAF